MRSCVQGHGQDNRCAAPSHDRKYGCLQGHGPDNLCAALVMTESMAVFKDMGGQSLHCLSHDYCMVVVKDTDRQALDRLTSWMEYLSRARTGDL